MNKHVRKILIFFLSAALMFTDISIPVFSLQTTVTAYAGPFSFFGDLWKTIVEKIADFAIRKDALFPITPWFSDDGEDGDIPDSRNASAQILITILDEVTSKAYEYTYEKVKNDATSEGYDVDTTAQSYETGGNVLSSIDYAYILSVYSLAHPDNELTIGAFRQDMEKIIPQLITVDYTDAVTTQYEAVPFYKYEKVTVGTCEDRYVVVGYTPEWTDDQLVTHGGDPIYGWRHFKVNKDYYHIKKDENGEPLVDFMIFQEEGRLVTDYELQSVDIYRGYNSEHDTDTENYYLIGEGDGEEKNKRREFPVSREVDYGQVTATSFSNDDLWNILGIDKEEKYFIQMSEKTKQRDGASAKEPDFKDGPTNYEMAQFRYEMFTELYDVAISSAYVKYRAGLTQGEIEAYLDSLPAETSGNRRQVVKTALVMVGQLPYCNNGEDSKPGKPGYDEGWYDYSRCDASGRPSGLDSSGFVQWVFWTSGFTQTEVANLKTVSLISNRIEELTDKEKLKPGDIGLIKLSGSGDDTEKYNRVGIYLNEGKWIINSPDEGTVVITSGDDFSSFKLFSPRMEDDDLYTDEIIFYAGGTADIGGDSGSLYTIAQVCLQECDDESTGTLAVAECVKNRAVDQTEFSGVNTAWEVVTQKGQFESYSSGAYKKRQPTSGIMTRIKQVFSARLTVLNNPHVLYFVSRAYHSKHYGDPSDFRTAMDVFGEYGGNVYYIKSEYRGTTLSGGATFFANGKDVANLSIPDNGSSNPVVYMAQGNYDNVAYGSGTVSSCGCGIVSCAMAVSFCLGGTDRSKWVTPKQILETIKANTGSINTHYTSGEGSNHDIAVNVASYYGLEHSGFLSASSLTEADVLKRLRSGQVAVAVTHSSIFTKNGHFILLTGADSTGSIYVNDPNGSHSGYSYNRYSWSFLKKTDGERSSKGGIESVVFISKK